MTGDFLGTKTDVHLPAFLSLSIPRFLFFLRAANHVNKIFFVEALARSRQESIKRKISIVSFHFVHYTSKCNERLISKQLIHP